ncbi:alpha/beta hydrolase [Novosphingobium sp. Chol11]|uniref:alpha/beta fold hydrolase n=1 Tax=Novosphingobium sp. Chol11 TaxID=1385763 RepID=UPI0025E888E2|nr:alpha/beta hydrolase [Novosphingobium sp. Chol11]
MARLDCGEGRSVYYEYHRGSATPIVLIHGWAMSSRIWAGTIEALTAAGHGVIAIDHRGCGQSDRDFDDMSINALADDVVQIVRKTTAAPVVLNGWSLGGAVAAQAAQALGDQAAGLVLTCGASPRFTKTEDFPYGGEAESLAASAAALAGDRAGFFRGLASGVCAREVSPDMVNWMWAAFIDSGPNVIHSLLDLANVEQRALLAELSIPVLSIVGAADAILDPQVGMAAAKLARKGSLSSFEGCGHAPFIEDAPQYLSVLREFLATI